MRKLLLILFAAALMTSLPLVHAVEHEWTNKQGKTIKAGFVSATNEAVTISMRGKNFEVKFTNLIPESVALAKRLQGVVKAGLQVKNEGLVLGKPYSIPNLNLDMLWCKPGTFMMGSPEDEAEEFEEETQHEGPLTKGFYLGKYEVTQSQWKKVMGKNPSHFKGATLPVEKVSWEDAIKFCEKLTQVEKEAGRLPKGYIYTLPTEAQWEYACRAGTTTAYSFGDKITRRQANFNQNVGKTTAVGTYRANAWGFHDMHGNVWESCLDWDDPSGSVQTYRGGSWCYDGREMRSAGRYWDESGFRGNDTGFRLSLQTATAKTE